MDLLNTVRKTGSRGGVNFSWSDVASSSHRENYLGHSLMAPVGRWQQGRDLTWYAKADGESGTDKDGNPETAEERAARERRDEMRKVKEAEEDAMARALGLPPPVRDVSGANAVELEGPKRVLGPAAPEGEMASPKEKGTRDGHRRRRDRDDGRSRRHRHGDGDLEDGRHRRSHRERSRSRDRSIRRDRSPRRGHGSRERRQRDSTGRRRNSRSPTRDTKRESERRDRKYYRDRSRSPERRERNRTRSRDVRRRRSTERRRGMTPDRPGRDRDDRDGGYDRSP